MLEVREVHKGKELVGLVGRKDSGEILVRAVDKESEIDIKSTIGPIRVSGAVVDSEISFSNNKIIEETEKEWLLYFDISLPVEYHVGPVINMKAMAFKIVKLA